MYVKNRHKDGLGQIPTNTVNLTLGSNKTSVTGPVNETAQAVVLVSMLSSAVSAASAGKATEARAVLVNAKGLLPTTGSLASQISPFIIAAESQVNAAGGSSAQKSVNPMLVAGGIGAVVIVGLLLLRR